MADDIPPFDIEGMDPAAATAVAAKTAPKLMQVQSAEDYEKVPHGRAYLDPEGKQRFKPLRTKEDYESLGEGAEYADPQGNIRTKPRYQGIDFTPQALYDIAHSDKGRRAALEKFYPGKVKEDYAGELYIDDDGKLRKPGRGIAAGAGFVATETIPMILAGLGAGLGGAAGTLAEPGGGTIVGGAAGAYGGGYMGQRINDIFAQIAGVYDPEGAEANARMSGYFSAAGDVGGRALYAAAPTLKKGAQAVGKGSAKAVAKFLGASEEKLETAVPIAEAGEIPGAGPFGLSKPGTAVSPSAIFESAPHVTNVAEILQQKFDRSDTYLANAERFMDKRAKEILASRDIGSIVTDSLVHPKAAVATEEAGTVLKESARLRAINESVEADRQLVDLIASRRAGVEAKYAPEIARKQSVVKVAEDAKIAADNLVEQGFRDIQRQADDAIRVARVGHNAGDLWRTVAESFVALRRSIGARANQMYTNAETASGGLVPPGAGELAGTARQLLAELPDGFEGMHPTIVRRLRDMAGEVAENGEVVREPVDATWVQLHNLRSQIRQDIKWNDLPSDIRNGTLKFLERHINDVLHPVEEGEVKPSIKAEAKSFDEFFKAAPAPKAASVVRDQNKIKRVAETIDPLIKDLEGKFPSLAKQLRDIRNQFGAANTNIDVDEVWDRLDQALSMIENNAGKSPLTERLSQMLSDIGDLQDEPFMRYAASSAERNTAYKDFYKHTYDQLVDPKAEWRKQWTDKQMLESLESEYQDRTGNPLFGYAEKTAWDDAAKVIRARMSDGGQGGSIKEASRLLRLADNFYRENMGPLNAQEIKQLVKALDSGLQADPKALLKMAIRDGKTEVANTIRDTVGPATWDAMRAADVQEMLARSRQLDGSIDGMQFAKQVKDRFQNGVLGVLHGEPGAARLQQQALYIEQLRGKLPIQPRPGDTANDIILRARSAVADVERQSKEDPLKLMQNEMKKVEAATRKEFAATRQPDQLAFLTNSTVGAHEAVNKILDDPDLIVAAARAFPGGEKSAEFNLIRQIWAERFLRTTLQPGKKLSAESPEIQALMFPGVTLDDMRMLAKEMELLMSGATMRRGGGDVGGSIMAQSAVENPLGRASGLGKLAGPAKVLPGVNMAARTVLTAYYNTIRGVLTSPSTLRWLRTGLKSRDPVAQEAARQELFAALQKGGVIGAAVGRGAAGFEQEQPEGVNP